MSAPGLPCPECGSDESAVIDSRVIDRKRRRRHECSNHHRYTTYEVIEGEPMHLSATLRAAAADELRKMARELEAGGMILGIEEMLSEELKKGNQPQ